MRALIFVGFLLAAVVAVAAPSWDGTFKRTGSVSMDGGQQLLAVTKSTSAAPTYVKANCTSDTRIGVGYQTDGGAGAYACLLGDAGLPCDLYRFSLGEKFYCSMAAGLNTVVLYNTGSGVCDVYEGR